MSVIAVIAAHPDDEVLGVGGTLRRHVERGDEVHAVVVSDGASSRYPDEMIGTLRDSAERSAERLGIARIEVGALLDQRLDAMPMVEMTGYIEERLAAIKPDVVYTHFAGDANTDHAVVARAAWTACRPYVLPQLGRFAVYETPSSTEWAWPMDGGTFRPNLFIDISHTLKVKLAAMECYHSELRDYPHPRSLRALAERAAYWGSRVGLLAAEPFQVLREVEQ